MDVELERLLAASVGPAPWYWETFPRLSARGVDYYWRLGEDGRVFLEREGGAAALLGLGFYARPLAADDGYVLVWRPERRALRIAVFELDRLEALADAPSLNRRPRGVAVDSRTPPVEDIAIREGLAEGTHRHHSYRSRFSNRLDEVLLIGNGRPGAPAEASIYVWRPLAGEVEVLPQEWFTEDAFDLGYEWITRVVRDPRTGRLAGDGIRISPFVLAEDGKTLAAGYAGS